MNHNRIILFSIILFVSFSVYQNAYGAITEDSANRSTGSSQYDDPTFSHSIAVGSDAVIVVVVSIESGIDISDVTWGGTGLTEAVDATFSGTCATEIWYAVIGDISGSTDTRTVTITTTGAKKSVFAGYGFYGVHQTDTIDDAQFHTSESVDPTRAITATFADGRTVEGICVENTNISPTAGQTEHYDINNSIKGAGYTEQLVGSGGFTQTLDKALDGKKHAYAVILMREAPTDADNDTFFVDFGTLDCNDADNTIFPGATELDDGKDNDCDETIDEGLDFDADGFTPIFGGDCNDADDTIFPGATELDDGKDNDCDGTIDEGLDLDADGFTPISGLDCNDNDASIFPGAFEIIGDGIDQDCDGADTAPIDADNDTYFGILDCDDNDASIFPGATEIIGDGIDQDCDGIDTAPTDADNDRYFVDFGVLDCDDNDVNVNPRAIEIPDNNVDENCDGIIESPPITDIDGDGFSPAQGDCDDNDITTYPNATELLDGLDNDCDGVVPDNELDNDGDGFRYHADGSGLGLDCNDNDPTIYPGAPEIDGDGIDSDCDGNDSVPSLESVKEKIPDWIKNNAGWWAEGKIDDNSFVKGIQYLIVEGIMKIPPTSQETGSGSDVIPSWIKNTAGWWADGVIKDDDFVSGIKYLVEQGIIKI